MTDIVIRADSLGKRYTLGHAGSQGYRTMRESLVEAIKKPIRRWRDNRPPDGKADFWALRDVSFEIGRGEVVGVIGRNGAGKSTLLKVLSRITEPTKGRLSLKGRVASLLEVGTGFHPELTGRENIFLNGAILGMHRREIKARFDEIVAFAEVDKFLDTPVKRYSSGMYVRLAFAVADHLEPEILVVDEVLAVGDSQFQKKCLGKMQDVSKQEGRTILFVSHQMGAIENLCTRGIVLGAGSVVFDGSTRDAINVYLNDLEQRTASADLRTLRRKGNGAIKLTGFSLQDKEWRPAASVASGDDVNIVLEYECLPETRISQLNVGISLHNQLGDLLSIYYSDYGGHQFADIPSTGRVTCHLPGFPFAPGQYYVGARVLANGQEADWPNDFIGTISVEGGDFYGSGAFGQHGLGPVLLRGEWHLNGNAAEVAHRGV